MPDVGQFRLALDILRAIRRPLFEGAASLDRQLAALGQRHGNSSGAVSNLPSAAQLQVAWAVLVTVLAPWGLREGLPQTAIGSFREQAANNLLALQPGNPRSSYAMGEAAVVNAATGSTSRLRDPLPHYQRGVELARAQGSDFWLARWAGAGGWGNYKKLFY